MAAVRHALLSACLALTNAPSLSSQGDYAAPIMAGMSNHGRTGHDPYVTAGDRAYLIGMQDGSFPDVGDHVRGEMGGLWLHPIKLIDGFRASLTEPVTGEVVALASSDEFINYPYGNRFRYGRVLDSLEVDRFQFSPDGQDGLIVQYVFRNMAGRSREVRLDFAVRTDLRPVWYSEHLGIRDSPDTGAWEPARGLFLAHDSANPWFVVWGATDSTRVQPVDHPRPLPSRGTGITAASRHNVRVDAAGTATVTFVIAGSARDEGAAVAAYRHLVSNHARLLDEKKERLTSLLDRAKVSIPDREWQEIYNWVRVNADWLVRDVPGFGRGLGAGLMEYPWWFGTETYSLQALMATGDFDLSRQTLRLLRQWSDRTNGNGRIVHEVTTNGAISNPGNTQETAQFILTTGRLVRWSGDLEFAREMYPAMKQGLHWLLTDMDADRNLFPGGYGIMEVLGLNAELIDVAVYTAEALRETAYIAGILNQPEAAERYRNVASQLVTRINQGFWSEEDESYTDFYGSRAQAVSAAEGAIRQIRLKGKDKLRPRDRELIGYYERLGRKFAAAPDRRRGWLTNRNWVIATPMETGIAPRERAIRLLDKIRRENVGEYGPFLSATERLSMMTIATGVQAVAEANYGRTDEALWYVDRIVETFNRVTPGSISEMMPDGGCFVIAWTSYGIVVPLIQHVFGIQPDAVSRTVVFAPHLPTGWENMSIEDLPIGTNSVSFSRAKTEKGIEYDIESEDGAWNLVLAGEALSPGARYFLNGRPVSATGAGIRMSGRKNHVLAVP
jgi:glycogen debranching enzyme